MKPSSIQSFLLQLLILFWFGLDGSFDSSGIEAQYLSSNYTFCYMATYKPTRENNFALSVTYSGLFNTTSIGIDIDGSLSGEVGSSYYIVQAISGQRNYTSLMGSTLASLSYLNTTNMNLTNDNYLYYPPLSNNNQSVDSKGIGFTVTPGNQTIAGCVCGNCAADLFVLSYSAQTNSIIEAVAESHIYGVDYRYSVSSFKITPFDPASTLLTSAGSVAGCVAPFVPTFFQFTFCYIATYQPSLYNNYAISLTYSGVLNTTGAAYRGTDIFYVVQALSGQRIYTTLTDSFPSSISYLDVEYEFNDNYIYYPPYSNNSNQSVDAHGMGFLVSPSSEGIWSGYPSTYNDSAYVLYNRNQYPYVVEQALDYYYNSDLGPVIPSTASFTVAPYNSSSNSTTIAVTSAGALASCVVPFYQYTFCYIAIYQPSSSNGYALSLTYSGIFNSSGISYTSTGNPYYLIQDLSGQRNYTTYTNSYVTSLAYLGSYNISDNFLYYPPLPNTNQSVDVSGIAFSVQSYDQAIVPGAEPDFASSFRLYYSSVTGNVVEWTEFGEPGPATSSFIISPLNFTSNTQLTANGAVAACTAPPVVQAYQYAFCYFATYQPQLSNGYAISLMYSGIFYTVGPFYISIGNFTQYYIVQSISGQRNYSTTANSYLTSLSYLSNYYGSDNFLYYSPISNNFSVDASGIAFNAQPSTQGLFASNSNAIGTGAFKLMLNNSKVVEVQNISTEAIPAASSFTVSLSSTPLTSAGGVAACLTPPSSSANLISSSATPPVKSSSSLITSFVTSSVSSSTHVLDKVATSSPNSAVSTFASLSSTIPSAIASSTIPLSSGAPLSSSSSLPVAPSSPSPLISPPSISSSFPLAPGSSSSNPTRNAASSSSSYASGEGNVGSTAVPLPGVTLPGSPSAEQTLSQIPTSVSSLSIRSSSSAISSESSGFSSPAPICRSSPPTSAGSVAIVFIVLTTLSSITSNIIFELIGDIVSDVAPHYSLSHDELQLTSAFSCGGGIGYTPANIEVHSQTKGWNLLKFNRRKLMQQADTQLTFFIDNIQVTTLNSSVTATMLGNQFAADVAAGKFSSIPTVIPPVIVSQLGGNGAGSSSSSSLSSGEMAGIIIGSVVAACIICIIFIYCCFKSSHPSKATVARYSAPDNPTTTRNLTFATPRPSVSGKRISHITQVEMQLIEEIKAALPAKVVKYAGPAGTISRLRNEYPIPVTRP